MERLIGFVTLSAGAVAGYYAALAILLAPVVARRWKKDSWYGLDLGLLVLPGIAISAFCVSVTSCGMEQLLLAHYLGVGGAALMGWLRGLLLKVLPNERSSLFWGLLAFVWGVASVFLAPRGDC